MTSRQSLPEQAARSRDSLVRAVDATGNNTELVAHRARNLLRWKPSGADRDAWLGTVLSDRKYVKAATTALRTVNGGAKKAGAEAQDETDQSQTGPDRQRSRGRRGQRGHRHGRT